MRRLSKRDIDSFRKTVFSYYRRHGRDLPWRKTREPYRIFVSEMMLQQTPVKRVLEKYGRFMERFPDFESVAKAPLKDVLAAWQGLGYNRRAIALQKAGGMVVREFGGELPRTVERLMTLPGIGHATACEIAAFAFEAPVVFIETNVRTVFIHHFFTDADARVSDREILPLVEETLDVTRPREWYYALMDYGVMLKKEKGNPGRRSAHHVRQAPFENSDRQVRGGIVRLLVAEPVLSEYQIARRIRKSRRRVRENLERLESEGFLQRRGGRYRIAE